MARAFQLRRDHAGIVEHQHIARAQQAGQIAHVMILERLIRPAHHQHPRGITRGRRAQGDALCREVEIEEVYAHGAFAWVL